MIFPVLPVGLGIDVNSLIFAWFLLYLVRMTKIPPLVRFLLLYYSAYLECAHFLGLTFSQISPFICYNSVDEKGGNFWNKQK